MAILTDNKCPNCGRNLYYYNDKNDALFDEMSPTITKIVCPFCLSGWNVNSVTQHTSYRVAVTPMVQRGEKINKTLGINEKSAHDNAQKILDDYSKELRFVTFKIYDDRIKASNPLSNYTSFAKKYSDYEYDETIGKAVAFLRTISWPESTITKTIFG